ncbi:outer membrane protein transport protein [Alkanindiges illinoisensis]|uniref:outer membrane protein transport protein n=1 Tax=Alkanindiges illinoisensis TaxID=197183 RepID=UPI00047D7299|nr:outer membrane protein transport protein [Alkanindiges illinoisensis]
MKMKSLAAAIALTLVPVTSVFAAALDRSGQSVAAFLQPDNYFEAGFSVLDPDVSGKEAGTTITRRNIGDMADDYAFPQAAIKLQPTKNFSFGILYDQPFGADAKYSGNNAFVSQGTDTAILSQGLANTIFSGLSATQRVGAALQAQGVDLSTAAGQARLAATVAAYNADPTTKQTIDNGVKAVVDARVAGALTSPGVTVGGTGGGTQVEVETQNLSFLFGFQPNENFNFYAGPVYQTIKGDVNLRGLAYSVYSGYDAKISEETAWGWLAGMAYQIPEIALKASITYRSEIDYDANVKETIPTLGALALLDPTAPATIAAAQGTTAITTPQSVNLDFQTGIMANTVAFANVRWVDWTNFTIQPYKFGLVSKAVGALANQPNGFNLVEYSDDQWSANVGVGRKVNDKWAGNVSVGWDSGAGNPVSTLGPTEGYWNAGVGIQYSPAPNYFVAGGVKYFWLGDAKAQTGAQAGTNAYAADFSDNSAIAYGLKLGYRF